jgi:hypothetical protein
VSTIDADHGLSVQTHSAKVVLEAYRQILLFLFPDASTIVAILVVLIFLPYSIQNTAGQPIPIFIVVVMTGTISAFILWGFVAGFAEHMVYNFLNHFCAEYRQGRSAPGCECRAAIDSKAIAHLLRPRASFLQVRIRLASAMFPRRPRLPEGLANQT